MKPILLSVMIIFIGAALAEAAATQTMMPSGCENITLGMDWNTFLTIRPHVQLFNLSVESESDLLPQRDHPHGGLLETLPDNQEFSKAFYAFEQGMLVAVTFGKEQKDISKERETFMRRMAKTRGMPNKITVMSSDEQYGVMIWRTEDVHINAIVPFKTDTASRQFVILQIMTQQYAEQLERQEIRDSTPTSGAQNHQAALDALQQEMIMYMESQDETP